MVTGCLTLLCLVLPVSFFSSLHARKNGFDIFPNSVVTNLSTCASSGCHDGPSGSTLNQFGSATFSGLPTAFTPGQTYNIGVTLTGTASTRVYGFQLAVMHSDKSQAGTLTAVTSGVSKHTPPELGVEHLFHAPSPLTSGNFTFQWTAPTVLKGEVTFRIAANLANNNSDPSGDHIRTSETKIAAAKNEKLYFAHFGDGEVQSAGIQLFSQIALVNLSSTSPVNATVEIFNDDGGLLEVDLNGALVSGRKDVEIPAAGSAVLKTDGRGAVQAGSVVVSSELPLSGVILFGGTIGVAGVGSSKALSKFVAPMEMDQANGVFTGIAFMNLESSDQTIQLELRDLNGQVAATGTARTQDKPLKARGHFAAFLDQFNWTSPPNLTSFRGTLRANTSGGGKIAATVIRLSPKEFATLPVTEVQ